MGLVMSGVVLEELRTCLEVARDDGLKSDELGLEYLEDTKQVSPIVSSMVFTTCSRMSRSYQKFLVQVVLLDSPNRDIS